MAAISSFDRWQKDVFFSAAEEVQESADKLESVYRMWIRYHRDEFESEISDELLRELHTALGTAKWQLEEFERAVNLSHGSCSAEENTITRRREFVAAIGNQISHIEKSLNDTLVEEGKQPLHWVQLDEEERDDLAVFLSAAPQQSQDTIMGSVQVKIIPDSVRDCKETVTINKDSRYVVKVAAKEPFKIKDEVIAQEEHLDEQRRACSSPDIGAWKIMIAEEQDDDRKIGTWPEKPNHASKLCGLLRTVESAAKSKLFRKSFLKAKSGEHLQLKQELSSYLDSKRICQFAQGMNGLSERSRNCFSSCNEDSKVSNVQQLVGRASGLRRHIQGPQYYMQLGRSLRITIFLLLTIILIAPFVLYST